MLQILIVKGVDIMLPKRVEEILGSPKYYEVLYNNQPVLIEKLNKEQSTVSVKINDTGEHMDVPVVNLTETGKVQ
jgi:H-type small acid-soluble spore protein